MTKPTTWGEDFDRTWRNTQGITVLDKPLKEFIAQVERDAEKRGFDRACLFFLYRQPEYKEPARTEEGLIDKK